MADIPPAPSRATPDPVVELSPEGPAPAASSTAAPVRRRLLRTLVVDVTPLRESRDFRLLFAGQGVSFAGSMLTYVAVPYQAYALTHSSLVVGLVSLAELGPIIVMAIVGGVLADAVDRRRMARITELAMCITTGALLLNALLPHPQLSVLFACVACAAGIDALQRPSLDAIVPRLVPRERLSAAAALESLRGTAGQIVGPALAGVLIATVGLPLTYGVDVASFAASLTALSLMRPVPPADDATPFSLRAAGEGFRFALRRQELLGSYAVDINAMFFGMPLALFPQIATAFGGPAALGVLYMAPAAGAFIASATSGWTATVRRHGMAIAIAAASWGVAICAFGFAPSLWLAFLALAAAGGADMISGIFRQTLWNQTIPDAMRGRLAGIEMISYTSGPALGNLESGVVGALTSVRIAVVSGGAACVVGTVILAASLRSFWRYRAR